jgi:hypothetical protein
VKYNKNIITKVISKENNYIEYISIEFFIKIAFNISILRLYSFIKFSPFCIIFILYISKIILTKAWPSLLYSDKVSIQHQLDNIFY